MHPQIYNEMNRNISYWRHKSSQKQWLTIVVYIYEQQQENKAQLISDLRNMNFLSVFSYEFRSLNIEI